jgi:hypothetical protein
MAVRRASSVSIAVVVAGLTLAGSVALKLQAQQAGPAVIPRTAAKAATGAAPRSSLPPSHVALVDEYCLSCHDEDHKKAGLALDAFTSSDISQHPEIWEKVIRKLRARQMPPIGQERPDDPTYDAVIASLETSLDRAARANPNP